MKVIAVCLGNICRSPLAHGLLQAKSDSLGLNWEVASAGTSSYHEGALPHEGSMEIAAAHGLDLSSQRSQQFEKSDLDYYDLILVMDSSNYANILAMTSTELHRDKIKLILNYVTSGQNQAVPDPYYAGGFDKVYDMLDDATDKVIEKHR